MSEEKKYLSVRMPLGEALQLIKQAEYEKKLYVDFALWDNIKDYEENKERPRFKNGRIVAFLNTFNPKKKPGFTTEDI